MRLLLGWALLLGLSAPPARANDFAQEAIGTAGSEFLLFDVGARGIGMGGAYTALTHDAYSLYWNPAGLTRVPRFSAAFMYAHYIAETNYQSAAIAQRVNDNSVIGAGWRYQDLGDVTQTDVSNNDVGKFHPRSYVGEVGWGQTLYDLSDSEMELAVGATGRWIHTDLIRHGDGFGGDLGIQSRFYAGTKIYDIGFTAQNMGRGQNFDRIRDTLPFRARLGGAAYPIRNLTVSLEAILPVNNAPHGAIGAEYLWEMGKNIKTMFRAGFNSLTVNTLGPFSAMSMGMGLSVSDFTVDYAFVPFGVLGTADVHRISFSFNLPSKVSRRYRER